MSTIKISQLQQITQLESNTSNTLLVGVDTTLGVTGKITVTTLAAGLYSNNALIVGSNPLLFSNTAAQFSGSDPAFLQTNLQNFSNTGSGDYIVTADTGTNSGGFIDLGINNSQWNSAAVGQTAEYPLDGYLIVDGPGTSPVGNLIIGTANPSTGIVLVAGGLAQNNIVARVTSSGISLNTAMSLAFADGTQQITAGSSVANTIYLQTLNNNQNTSVASVNTFTQSAYNKANTALQNTANILISGNLVVAQTLTMNGNTIFNSNTIHYGNLITNGNVITNGSTVFNGQFINNGNTINNGLTTLNGILYVAGSILPANNNIALGSPSAPFQNIYTSNSTVVLANANVAVTGTFTANGQSDFNGLVLMQNSQYNANVGSLEIVASANGAVVPPAANGTLLHITGLDSVTTKLMVDNFGPGNTYSLFVGRAGRGSAGAPSATQAGDVIARYSGSSYGTTGFTSTGSGRMDITALENHSDTNRGTMISFGMAPVGSNTIVTAMSITSNTIYFANNTMVANTETANTLVANTIVFGSATANSMVTQQTSKSTSVTANGTSGQITMNNAQLTHATEVVFTVNNSYVQHVNDIPIVAIQNPITAGQYIASVAAVRVGSFDIMISNLGAGPAQDKSDAIILNWALLRVGS
jgi:hypothetical protein